MRRHLTLRLTLTLSVNLSSAILLINRSGTPQAAKIEATMGIIQDLDKSIRRGEIVNMSGLDHKPTENKLGACTPKSKAPGVATKDWLADLGWN